MNTEEFIIKSKKIQNNEYTYDNAIFSGCI